MDTRIPLPREQSPHTGLWEDRKKVVPKHDTNRNAQSGGKRKRPGK